VLRACNGLWRPQNLSDVKDLPKLKSVQSESITGHVLVPYSEIVTSQSRPRFFDSLQWRGELPSNACSFISVPPTFFGMFYTAVARPTLLVMFSVKICLRFVGNFRLFVFILPYLLFNCYNEGRLNISRHSSKPPYGTAAVLLFNMVKIYGVPADLVRKNCLKSAPVRSAGYSVPIELSALVE
jgi:hypothetical protein